MTQYLIIIAIIIIAALAGYAGLLLFKLHKQQQQQKQAQLEAEQKQQEQLESTLNSLMIIARSVASEQCDISEGSWRVSVLLESQKTGILANQINEYSAIQALYQGIKHMPILDARKQLDKKSRMKFDLERMKLESKLNDDVHAEMATLANFAQDQLEKLR